MNKTVQSIVSLTAFSALLIAITSFCGGLGIGRAMQPKTIMLLLGLECCSILLWLAFICIEQCLLDWQITDCILHVAGLDGFTGDERGLNILAVLCGIVYPLIGIVCLFTGLRIIKNGLVKTKGGI